MNIDTVGWALEQRIARSAAKFVLVVLAYSANADSQAAPSVGWLVDITGLDRKTVIASLQALQESGLIEDTGEREGATRNIKVYRLHVESERTP